MPVFKHLRNTPIHSILWRAYMSGAGLNQEDTYLAYPDWVKYYGGAKYHSTQDLYEFKDENHLSSFLLKWG
jgi:hypothetical protein